MKKFGFAALTLGLFAVMLAASPAFGQSPIMVRSNSKPVGNDIEIGQKLLARFIADGLLTVDDPLVANYVQRLGDLLVKAIRAQKAGNPHVPDYVQVVDKQTVHLAPQDVLPPLRCYFYVVDNDENEYNAFAVPGCLIFINKTVIKSADNEGQLAGIIAHELAHPFLRHGTADRARLPKILAYLGIYGGAAIGGSLGQAIQHQSAYHYIVHSLLPHSREDEDAADLFGTQTMALAGYDPDDLGVDFQHITNLLKNAGVSRVRVNMMDHDASDKRGDAVFLEAEALRRAGWYDKQKVWPMSEEFLRVQAKLKA
jgi:predicted Zn-dependent protease